jgi:hypothetical protein
MRCMLDAESWSLCVSARVWQMAWTNLAIFLRLFFERS